MKVERLETPSSFEYRAHGSAWSSGTQLFLRDPTPHPHLIGRFSDNPPETPDLVRTPAPQLPPLRSPSMARRRRSCRACIGDYVFSHSFGVYLLVGCGVLCGFLGEVVAALAVVV